MLKMMLKIDLIVKIHIEKLLHAAATNIVVTVIPETSHPSR